VKKGIKEELFRSLSRLCFMDKIKSVDPRYGF